MNQQQLFLQSNPGVDLSTPQGQAAFQTWLQSNPAPAAQAGAGSGLNLGAISGGLNQAVTGSTTGGNTDQLQGAQQSGAFNTAGTTTASGTQQEQGTQQGTTQQQQQQTGQTQTSGLQTTTGQQATSGTSQPIDTLGLGALLQSMAPGAATATGTAQNFLEGVTQGNNPLLQAQTSNAVNQATSGPGMVGAGQGANARAAGDAAAQVGLNSQGQQINAASVLGSPTAATTLANAGSPFVGTATTGNATTSGTQATSGNTLSSQDLSSLTNSLNLSSLLNSSNTTTNEQQGGTSSANSTQEAIGQVPQSQTTSGSGCYVCTSYVQLGRLKRTPIRRAAKYKLGLRKYDRALAGYSVYGPALARFVLANRLFQTAFFPIAKAILYEECRLAHGRLGHKTFPTICHAIFHYGSIPFAWVTGRRKMVTDAETSRFLYSNDLYFS